MEHLLENIKNNARIEKPNGVETQHRQKVGNESLKWKGCFIKGIVVEEVSRTLKQSMYYLQTKQRLHPSGNEINTG